ncbi:Oidioi.mRNA.OKI2018_I69.PAR.g10578.t1.cds [Oikopleura dioica]|uniref:Oidioi.mRNA.OKI2018_I69.PAR.g10578.t1.cds n=1 Tax=Oikopleura dioica TaxID=34765 RepID=A0ABN7RS52_OIKDI|nr:Oidioi.mRNA.OKI2018_I69.PAR.g10578.t1.cds [Oikopleura dioica]
MDDTTEGNRIARENICEDHANCALAGQEAEDNEDYETDYDSDASYEIVASTPLEPVQLPPDFNHACLTQDREIFHVKERDLVFEDEET